MKGDKQQSACTNSQWPKIKLYKIMMLLIVISFAMILIIKWNEVYYIGRIFCEYDIRIKNCNKIILYDASLKLFNEDNEILDKFDATNRRNFLIRKKIIYIGAENIMGDHGNYVQPVSKIELEYNGRKKVVRPNRFYRYSQKRKQKFEILVEFELN